MDVKHLFSTALSTVVLIIAVTGCNGGNRGDDNAANFDAFLNEINSIIGNTSESDEPKDIESINVTMPENKESIPIR